MRRLALAVLAGLTAITLPTAGVAVAQDAPASLASTPATAVEPVPGDAMALPTSRNGREIFDAFLAGRADPGCDDAASSARWERHFSHAPSRLANEDQDVLPLFGYVVDQLRDAGLPTEFALIPFVESGYRPGARNGSGPAGLWQFIAVTARNHKVPVSKQYDGRLSAVDSTAAAVRYLKTLYGMFGGDWRLAVMAYNAGEYRVLQSMRQAAMNAQNADPTKLPGLSKVSYAYVEKLHALACVLDRAQQQGPMMTGLDREVPILAPQTVPAGTTLQRWSRDQDLEHDLVARLNPALPATRTTIAPRHVLVPQGTGGNDALDAALMPGETTQVLADTDRAVSPATAANAGVDAGDRPRRTHTVRSGESAWSIARRYGISVKALLANNGLERASVLKPGMVLAFDDAR